MATINILQSCFSGTTVYPKKYAHGFVVLCFVVVMQSFVMNSHEVFIHIHQGCFAGTGAIVRLPQCQWSKPDGYGKISQCITTTKHCKAKTVCIFLGIYCRTLVRLTDVGELILMNMGIGHCLDQHDETQETTDRFGVDCILCGIAYGVDCILCGIAYPLQWSCPPIHSIPLMSHEKAHVNKRFPLHMSKTAETAYIMMPKCRILEYKQTILNFA